MTSFWPLDAARRRKASQVPGTSRWIAQELNTYNSGVLATAELFAHEMSDDYDFLNGFMARVVQNQPFEELEMFVETSTTQKSDPNTSNTSSLLADDASRTSQAAVLQFAEVDALDPSRNLKPEDNSEGMKGPNKEISVEKIQEVHPELGSNVKLPQTSIQGHVTQENPTSIASKQPGLAPMTLPTPQKIARSLFSNVNHLPHSKESKITRNEGFIPQNHGPRKNSRNSINLANASSPVVSTSAANFTFIPPETDKDDSFQAIRTAIRKSIAGKPIQSDLERKSIFAPLPTKEPLAVENRRKSSSWKALFEYKNELKRSSGIKRSEDDQLNTPEVPDIQIEHPSVATEKALSENVPTIGHVPNVPLSRVNSPKLEFPATSNSIIHESVENLPASTINTPSSLSKFQRQIKPQQELQAGKYGAKRGTVEIPLQNFSRDLELGRRIDGEGRKQDPVVGRNTSPNKRRPVLTSVRNGATIPMSRIPLKEIRPSETLVRPPVVDRKAKKSAVISPYEPADDGSPTKKTPRRSYNESSGNYPHLRRSRNVFMNTEESTVSKAVSSLNVDQKVNTTKEPSSKLILRSGLPTRRASPIKVSKEISQQKPLLESAKSEVKSVRSIPSLKSPLRRNILRVTGSPGRSKSTSRMLTGSPISSTARNTRNTVKKFTPKGGEASRLDNTVSRLESSPISAGKETLEKKEILVRKESTSSRSNDILVSRSKEGLISRSKESLVSTKSSPEKLPELDLISRLTTPTTSSAAKKRKTVDKKDMGMNKMLTATLNPTKPPRFSPNKNRYETLRQQVANRPIQSPVKRIIGKKEAKKSMSTSVDEQPSNKRQKTLTQLKIPTLKKSFHEEPKMTNKSAGGQSATKSLAYSNQNNASDRTTPGKHLDKPSRISAAKTPKRDHNPYKTPARSTKLLMLPVRTANTPALPEILSDDDVRGDKKALEKWAETPELKKVLLQQQNINPDNIFGKIPPLNMDDIFESQASRNRGRALLTLSPNT